ncbi:uncharacterized protein MEPE_01550 [Melanopsichium pennsylvanicum]|uniref:Uncharacterized protein n=1 Tax=Melanopsichium pennsylvanicum TaxID=63383 RepID=A0AAJ5C3U9_9BASI|nr:uncharacterized protein MEPE_01550 [Melanopsichium pennsylvanicum]
MKIFARLRGLVQRQSEHSWQYSAVAIGGYTADPRHFMDLGCKICRLLLRNDGSKVRRGRNVGCDWNKIIDTSRSEFYEKLKSKMRSISSEAATGSGVQHANQSYCARSVVFHVQYLCINAFEFQHRV